MGFRIGIFSVTLPNGTLYGKSGPFDLLDGWGPGWWLTRDIGIYLWHMQVLVKTMKKNMFVFRRQNSILT